MSLPPVATSPPAPNAMEAGASRTSAREGDSNSDRFDLALGLAMAGPSAPRDPKPVHGAQETPARETIAGGAIRKDSGVGASITPRAAALLAEATALGANAMAGGAAHGVQTLVDGISTLVDGMSPAESASAPASGRTRAARAAAALLAELVAQESSPVEAADGALGLARAAREEAAAGNRPSVEPADTRANVRAAVHDPATLQVRVTQSSTSLAGAARTAADAEARPAVPKDAAAAGAAPPASTTGASPANVAASAGSGGKHQEKSGHGHPSRTPDAAAVESAATADHANAPIASPAPSRIPPEPQAPEMLAPSTRAVSAEAAAPDVSRPAASDRVTVALDGVGGLEGRLRVALRGDTLHATIVTPDAAAAARMESTLGELHRALAGRGFGDVRIAVQSNPASSGAESGHERPDGREPRHERASQEQAARDHSGYGNRPSRRRFDRPQEG